MRRRRPAVDVARGAGTRLAAAALLAAVAACGGGKGDLDHGPGAAARRLFELARLDEPTDEQLEAAFGPLPGGRSRVALLDALTAMGQPDELEIVGIVPPEAPAQDLFLDLAARWTGGRVADYHVRLREAEPGAWIVTWFGGPGMEWPRSASRSGESLSSSAPPGPLR